MADQTQAPTQSHDAEKAQERKRRPEPAPEHTGAPAAEATAFAGLLGDSAMDLPVERHAALAGDGRFAHRANAIQRVRMVNQIQQSYGNAYVQRVIERVQTKERSTRTGKGEEQKPKSNLPPGPYTGRRKRNDLLDPFEYKQNIFAPIIFKRYGGNRKLWAPFQGLIHTYWVKNFGDQRGIRLDSPELIKAAWTLLRSLTTSSEMSVIKRIVKEQGEEKALTEAIFVEFSKAYPTAREHSQRDWGKSNFRLYHEWAAVHFGFVKEPYAYHAKG